MSAASSGPAQLYGTQQSRHIAAIVEKIRVHGHWILRTAAGQFDLAAAVRAH
jgi:hypothetical protein